MFFQVNLICSMSERSTIFNSNFIFQKTSSLNKMMFQCHVLPHIFRVFDQVLCIISGADIRLSIVLFFTGPPVAGTGRASLLTPVTQRVLAAFGVQIKIENCLRLQSIKIGN